MLPGRLEILAENRRRVIGRAEAAASRAGRAADSWRLVTVTKAVSVEIAAALVDLGAADLGENRVTELVSKQRTLVEPGIRWHMIGHLQRNKVKRVAGRVELIHSVDSERLADEIEKVASALEIAQKVLLEVNVSGEQSKYGLTGENALRIAENITAMEHVTLEGLMMMAPIVDDAEETRALFARLRELGERMAADGLFAGGGFELSMGMTRDFEVAIEEGATMIRVGSALFGGL